MERTLLKREFVLNNKKSRIEISIRDFLFNKLTLNKMPIEVS